jgi:3-oxoacyl-[acyl-carrier-protein] synthase-1
MSTGVQILAVGARTPLGLTAESSAAAVRGGIARLGRHPFLVDERGEMVRAAVDTRLEQRLLGWERIALLLTSAISEALGKLGALPRCNIEVLLALPECRPGFSDSDTERVVQALARVERWAELRFKVAGRGHAGVILAAQLAVERLSKGRTDLCVVAGGESYFVGETIEWLDANRQLTGENVRSGFIPGEAAGALVVATDAMRRRLRLGGRATLVGVHTAFEANRIKSEDDVLGEGLTAAVAGAMSRLRLPEESVDAVYCDINGERYRSEEWGFTVLRVERALRDSAYEAPANLWGDIGAASAALGCVLAVQAWARGYAAGPRALVWASSEGGLRGAFVLMRHVHG